MISVGTPRILGVQRISLLAAQARSANLGDAIADSNMRQLVILSEAKDLIRWAEAHRCTQNDAISPTSTPNWECRGQRPCQEREGVPRFLFILLAAGQRIELLMDVTPKLLTN